MPAVPQMSATAELLELEIPKRKTRLGKIATALVEMDVSKTQPLYFKCPEGVDMQVFSNRMQSHIATARRNAPGSSFVRRMVEFDGEQGVAVWRTK